jgi:hypothetical protein
MPVVIDEFEVVPAAEQPQQPTAAAGAPKPGAAAAPPQEIERVVRRLCERAMRLRAH